MADLYNREAEQYVIGSMLVNPSCIDEVAGIVTPEQFTDTTFRDLFYLIQSCSVRGLAVDVVSLSTIRDKLSNGDSTIACAAEVMANQAGSSNVNACAAVVAEKHKLRQCQKAITTLANQIKTSEIDSAGFLAQAQAELTALAGNEKVSDVCFIGERLHELRDSLMARVEAGGKISGLLTGYHDIDNIIEGMRGNMMIVMAGRPGSGKTTLAINIMENLALEKKPSLIFSLEMANLELSTRILASLGRVPISNLNRGKIEDYNAGLTVGISRMKELPIIVCERQGLTIDAIRSIARFQHRMNKVELIVIDYLSIVRTHKTKQSTRSLELGEVSRQCKEMSKELNVPVIVLAQLNREIDKGGDRAPRLSDLRDSGEIEQDADIVAFLQSDVETGITQFVVAKHRHGKPASCSLLNRLDISRLESMPTGHTPQEKSAPKSARNYL